jgi:hypothetical protein
MSRQLCRIAGGYPGELGRESAEVGAQAERSGDTLFGIVGSQ